MISKAHCITLITYRIRRHRLNNDIHSITSSIIHLSTRTSSLLLPHRSIFDITMIFVDASIKMYMYTNKTTLREIDGDRVHSFCRSEAFYFSNILPHPFLVPPIIFPPWITNPFFPQIFLLVSKRFNFKQRYKNYSSIFSTRFSFKKSPSRARPSPFLPNFLRCYHVQTGRGERRVISSITAREFRCTQLSLRSTPEARLQPLSFLWRIMYVQHAMLQVVYTKIIYPDTSNTFKGEIERIFEYGKENTRGGGKMRVEMRVKRREE